MTPWSETEPMIDLRPAAAPWGWFVATGVGLVFFGLVAAANLLLASLAAMFVVGGMACAAGALMAIHAWGTRTFSRALFWALCGLAYIAVGVWIILQPLVAASALTLMLGVLLGFAGAVRVIAAVTERRHAWGWMVLSGVISLLAAAIILGGWPGTAVWVLGMVLAVDLLVQGFGLVLAGLAMRRLV